jgi:hypothetical protein
MRGWAAVAASVPCGTLGSHSNHPNRKASTMPTFQAADVTDTTDANGYLTYTFPNDVDRVMVTPASNQGSFLGASAVMTGAKTVQVRCWKENSGNTVGPFTSAQVTVNLLGVTGT